jgi:hypothetical membrane protein
MKKEKLIPAAVIGSVISYILVVLILGWLRPGYDHTTELVSDLGKSGALYNYVLNIVLVISGISLLLMAWLIYKLIPNSRILKYAVISFGLFAVSVICGGIFPCDESCLVPTSYSGFLHAITGLPAMLTAPLAFILFGIVLKTIPHFAPISKIVYWLGITSIFAMIASAVIFPYFNLMGLGQRIAAVFQLAVPFIIAYKLFSYQIQAEGRIFK